METYFKAYTRTVQGTLFYFVKKFTRFPEDPHIPDILERMGMHPEFLRACRLAGLHEDQAILELQAHLEAESATARIIPFILDSSLHAIS